MKILLQQALLGCFSSLAPISSAWSQSAPTNFQASVRSPTEVYLTWNPVAGTTGYHMWRTVGSAAFVRLNQNRFQQASYTDATASPGTTYRYRVVAVAPDLQTYPAFVTVTTPAQSTVAAMPSGRLAAVISATHPGAAPGDLSAAPMNPKNFTARQEGKDVVLTWDEVPGLTWYLLGGAGMGSHGQHVSGTRYTLQAVGPGQHEWTLASLGEDRKPLTDWAMWSKVRLTVGANSARYRISLAGFRVNHETYDDPLERDGKRDEVYAAAVLHRFNRKTGELLDSRALQSKVVGDWSGHRDRIAQGSASKDGGLMTGDVVPSGWDQQSTLPTPYPGWFPLVLWEGSLTDGEDVLAIRPTLWEWDGNPTGFAHWSQVLNEAAPKGTLSYGPIREDLEKPAISAITGGAIVRGYAAFGGDLALNVDPSHVDAGRDRPIGLKTDAYGSSNTWHDLIVPLTREKLEAELTRRDSPTPGLISLSLEDSKKGSFRALSGDYTLYLRVERVP
jgi:hypothetical protein